jgi:hypothetical protein
MIERTLDAGAPVGWVAADEVYGNNSKLRVWLEERRLSYVLAVLRINGCAGRMANSGVWIRLRIVCRPWPGNAFPPIWTAKANGYMTRL